MSGLIEAIDVVERRNPGISRWALADALARFHLSRPDPGLAGVDTAPMGMAFGIGGIGVPDFMRTGVGEGFGRDAATLRRFEGLGEGLARLGA